MNHDTLVLALELFALAVFVALGIWRIYKARETRQEDAHGVRYDMRRDGQRQTA